MSAVIWKCIRRGWGGQDFFVRNSRSHNSVYTFDNIRRSLFSDLILVAVIMIETSPVDYHKIQSPLFYLESFTFRMEGHRSLYPDRLIWRCRESLSPSYYCSLKTKMRELLSGNKSFTDSNSHNSSPASSQIPNRTPAVLFIQAIARMKVQMVE
jgi:hypothetical protein